MRYSSILYSLNKNTFFATTPIYYVNAKPHIGHLYTSLIADVAVRWQQLINPNIEIKFSTGTDEHGTKIQQAAHHLNQTPNVYCNEISLKYQQLADKFLVNYTDFIRTSNESHVEAVRTFWNRINNNGYIYKAKYSGWYCIADETFLTQSQLSETVKPDGSKAMVSAESGHPVEWFEEENYMFKLSNFHEDLIKWVSGKASIKPKRFAELLLDILGEELPDLSISRPSSRVHWGIKVPDDDSQTIYVWLDALINYLTVTGYPNNVNHMWPPDVQVIGKDILRFHGIYWPAFLLAANMELPKLLLCHSHWTVDDTKMSKSKNNVVCPLAKRDIYSTDGVRYFLMRAGVAKQDGNYNDLKVINALNAELADTLGNLLSRCTGHALNPKQIVPAVKPDALEEIFSKEVTKNLIDAIENLPDICYQHYQDYNYYKTADCVIAALHLGNLFFESMRPWELKKRPGKQDLLDATLHITIEALRVCSIILSPIIPKLAETLLNKISIFNTARSWNNLKDYSWNNPKFLARNLSGVKIILFKRIILDEEIKLQKVKR